MPVKTLQKPSQLLKLLAPSTFKTDIFYLLDAFEELLSYRVFSLKTKFLESCAPHSHFRGSKTCACSLSLALCVKKSRSTSQIPIFQGGLKIIRDWQATRVWKRGFNAFPSDCTSCEERRVTLYSRRGAQTRRHYSLCAKYIISLFERTSGAGHTEKAIFRESGRKTLTPYCRPCLYSY
jgi:hypothetical protein